MIPVVIIILVLVAIWLWHLINEGFKPKKISRVFIFIFIMLGIINAVFFILSIFRIWNLGKL